MSYSIKPFIDDYQNKDQLHKIGIRVIYKRFVVKAETEIRVTEKQFNGIHIIKHPHADKLNALIRKQCNEIEERLLDALRAGIDKTILKEIVKNKSFKTIDDFFQLLMPQLKGKISEGRLKHYKSVVGKLLLWRPKLSFDEVNVTLLNAFETHIRSQGLDGNTINSNMKLIKSFFNKAALAGLIDKRQFENYKPPKYVQKLVDYLTEDEVLRFHALIDAVAKPSYKLAGYYFLLSCYAGYRISDLKRFDYASMVQNDHIVLRTKKNATIVSIPLYPKLKVILDYIKDNPLLLSENKVRQYIKEIALLAGISKHVKPHTGRHTFAMMLINKDCPRDYIAELLGDTDLVTKVYARITNKQLSKKVLELLNR